MYKERRNEAASISISIYFVVYEVISLYQIHR